MSCISCYTFPPFSVLFRFNLAPTPPPSSLPPTPSPHPCRPPPRQLRSGCCPPSARAPRASPSAPDDAPVVLERDGHRLPLVPPLHVRPGPGRVRVPLLAVGALRLEGLGVVQRPLHDLVVHLQPGDGVVVGGPELLAEEGLGRVLRARRRRVRVDAPKSGPFDIFWSTRLQKKQQATRGSRTSDTRLVLFIPPPPPPPPLMAQMPMFLFFPII